MKSNKIYEPIRKKMEEWIWYDDHAPKSSYIDHVQEHDEYRRWHDRDCVLTGGNLNADTMFSLWLPLRHTIVRINGRETIREVGNINSKYAFLRELVKGDNLEKLLPAEQTVVHKLSVLFELGMGRENVFILPERWVNSARGMKPYYDYVPMFLRDCFPGGKFSSCWSSLEILQEWIEKEHFPMFFDGDIVPENIRDLSGAGDISISLPPEGIEPMERMLERYIDVLRERRKYFSVEEMEQAKEMEKMMYMDRNLQEFKERLENGDEQAVKQAEDIMGL